MEIQIFSQFLDTQKYFNILIFRRQSEGKIEVNINENAKNINIPNLNQNRNEEIKILKEDFEKRIFELIKKSDDDKNQFQNKIFNLEFELNSKIVEKKADSDKNKEIFEIQRQIEEFKLRTFEEVQ